MRTMELGRTGLYVPVIAVGIMHINRLDAAQAERIIQTCLEHGCIFFDHADVYGSDKAQFGRCEEIFAEAIHMSPAVREGIILQDKIGFMPPAQGSTRSERLNSSREYILKATDDSLRRLRTDYLDVLMLHAPDALADPEEIAEAVDTLRRSGKVRHFGVSNYNAMQLALLEKYLRMPIAANQLCLSIMNSGLISHSMYVNMDETEHSMDRSGYVLDYCRLRDITVECWSTMQFGGQQGTFIGNPAFAELNAALGTVAETHGVAASTIALAWLLRHPARLLPITGTMDTGHLLENIRAADVTLSRKEWYDIWAAAGNFLR